MENRQLINVDKGFDGTLRPSTLSEFLGMQPIIKRLNVLIKAAKGRDEALSHILFHGPPGLGKTTLSSLLSKEMNSNLITTSGPAIEKAGDLAGLLTNLEEKDILFIDEIHRMHISIEEYLYSAMETFSLDLMIDSGPSARSVSVKLKPFTLIGATTKLGMISSPLRSRFSVQIRLEHYDEKTLTEIVLRSASILSVSIDHKAAYAIAQRARGTPRTANNLLRWIRDYAQLHHENTIHLEAVHEACKMVAIDEEGLDDMDKRILQLIIDHYQGGPVGLKAIAAMIGEEETTIEDVYEPYLLKKGFLKRTPRGREVTNAAYEHLGLFL